MLFSILIANFNNGRFFQDCYDSIIAQSTHNWEVIIVDDASTDESVRIIKKMIDDDTRFHLYENEKNYGCGYTKRRCVELANGDICGFLDPDDALHNSAVEDMVNAHIKNENVVLIYSDLEIFENNFSSSPHPVIAKKQIDNFNDYFINYNGEVGHFSTFKKTHYLKTEGISSFMQRAVDVDLYLKLYEVGAFLYLPKVLYKYRIHEKGISTTNNRKIARYWFWLCVMEKARRKNINFENEFATNFLLPDECWLKREEANKKPLIIIKKLFHTLLNKIKK